MRLCGPLRTLRLCVEIVVNAEDAECRRGGKYHVSEDIYTGSFELDAHTFFADYVSPSKVPTPPSQPQTGPGGKQYLHTGVTKNRYGKGGKEYWIFEPDSPKPRTAPVIVFLHGWGGMNPLYYGAWMDHLVKRGNIVIYPRYQANLLTRDQRIHAKHFGCAQRCRQSFEN